MITHLRGDATCPTPTLNGGSTTIIAHVCNNARAWGAGFVLALSARWPEPERAYRTWSGGYGPPGAPPFRLGAVQWVPVEEGQILVANMLAQNGLRSKQNPVPLDYEALATCLERVSEHATRIGASVHMPRIGSGLARGNWDKVEALIQDKLASTPVFVYHL